MSSENRPHYDWYESLSQVAAKGNLTAQRILQEGENPGRYFDGSSHMFDLLRTLRDLQTDDGVQAIGIFGSRLRGDHRPLHSDIDIYVINDTPEYYLISFTGDVPAVPRRYRYRYCGISQGINIQECSTKNWNQVVTDPDSVNPKTYEILKAVRWLWVRPQYTVKSIPPRK